MNEQPLIEKGFSRWLVLIVTALSIAGAVIFGFAPFWLQSGKSQPTEPGYSQPGSYEFTCEVEKQVPGALVAGNSLEALALVGEASFVQPDADDWFGFSPRLDLCADDVEGGRFPSVETGGELIAHAGLDLSVLVSQDHLINSADLKTLALHIGQLNGRSFENLDGSILQHLVVCEAVRSPKNTRADSEGFPGVRFQRTPDRKPQRVVVSVSHGLTMRQTNPVSVRVVIIPVMHSEAA